jgi:hypothetical protein
MCAEKPVLKLVFGCVAALVIVAALSGCVARQRHHAPQYYDASNPLYRIAVLPMRNDTNDVDGPVVVRKKMIQFLADKAYNVKDVNVTDQTLRDRMGITLGGQLDLTTARELGMTLGVEGVLYGTLIDFNEVTTGAYNVRKVRALFKLVNTLTGEIVWQQGLGVRREIIMEGKTGDTATRLGRAVDARDKEAPWVNLKPIMVRTQNIGESFAVGLGARLLTGAVGLHLDSEATELARLVTQNIPWGPGPSAASMPDPVFPAPDAIQEMK